MTSMLATMPELSADILGLIFKAAVGEENGLQYLKWRTVSKTAKLAIEGVLSDKYNSAYLLEQDFSIALAAKYSSPETMKRIFQTFDVNSPKFVKFYRVAKRRSDLKPIFDAVMSARMNDVETLLGFFSPEGKCFVYRTGVCDMTAFCWKLFSKYTTEDKIREFAASASDYQFFDFVKTYVIHTSLKVRRRDLAILVCAQQGKIHLHDDVSTTIRRLRARIENRLSDLRAVYENLTSRMRMYKISLDAYDFVLKKLSGDFKKLELEYANADAKVFMTECAFHDLAGRRMSLSFAHGNICGETRKEFALRVKEHDELLRITQADLEKHQAELRAVNSEICAHLERMVECLNPAIRNASMYEEYILNLLEIELSP